MSTVKVVLDPADGTLTVSGLSPESQAEWMDVFRNIAKIQAEGDGELPVTFVVHADVEVDVRTAVTIIEDTEVDS